jgi:GntR family transcriptional regulator
MGQARTPVLLLTSTIQLVHYISMARAAQAGREWRWQLDLRSGVPVYRQIMDQVLAAIASGRLASGDQLPTVRQLAVDLSINPNTVIRAYRELEIRGFLDTHQGTGTFISAQRVEQDDDERRRKLDAIVSDAIARAGSEGFTARQVLDRLKELLAEQKRRS